MVLEPIRDLDVRFRFVWPYGGCLSVLPHNLVGHNEDVVFV